MEKLNVIVDSGNHDRYCCPINVKLPKYLNFDKEKSIKILDEKGIEFFGQYNNDSVFFIINKLSKYSKVKYTIIFTDKQVESKDNVKVIKKEKKVDVFIDEKLFTSYHYKDVVKPFLHPVLISDDESIVRGFPVAKKEGDSTDHIHHKGIWVGYGDINGVDNWTEEKGHGYVIHQNFEELESGPIFGKIKAINQWTDCKKNKILKEIRTMIFYNFKNIRLIDFIIEFNAELNDVKFGDTKEGGIVSVRVATSMEGVNGGIIENALGCLGEKECINIKSPWCDYSGKVNGKNWGISIFDHPQNFRFPTYWLIREQGWMTTNMFGISFFEENPEKKGDFILKKGNSLKFFYRVYIHPGDVVKGKVKENYQNFINPPLVTIV